MAIEIFNRYEKKYRLTSEQATLIQRTLDDRMLPDSYNREDYTYKIQNIYYDTDDSELIRTSLQKPKFKEKQRLRGYGDADPGKPVYVEIKKKVNGLVNKRRSAMYKDEAQKFLSTGVIPEAMPHHNRQVLAEVSLTPYEFRILTALIKKQEQAISRDELLNEIWGCDTDVETRATDDTVRRLRKKLAHSKVVIEAVWGFGFRLKKRE